MLHQGPSRRELAELFGMAEATVAKVEIRRRQLTEWGYHEANGQTILRDTLRRRATAWIDAALLIPAGGLIRSSEFALALGASREGWSAECDEIAGAVVADSWVAWVRWPPELFQAFWQIAATMRIIEHDPQPDRDCPRLESLVRAGRSHLHPSDGPEAPRFFWWRGKRLELRLEPRCWDLLVYLWPESGGWPKSDGPRDRVPISEIGRAVYGKRSVEYNRIKPDLSDLNTALADQSIGVTWAKVRGQKHLELQRSI